MKETVFIKQPLFLSMLNGTWQYVVFSVNDFAVGSLEYIASNDW